MSEEHNQKEVAYAPSSNTHVELQVNPTPSKISSNKKFKFELNLYTWLILISKFYI
jgi:hypothetical protein